ncbi:hypothetical protein FRC03_001316 [Tulasnella sp. 419]|nr:hypothetical protein FRC03_001316 [Tulasnella sp. 419]
MGLYGKVGTRHALSTSRIGACTPCFSITSSKRSPHTTIIITTLFVHSLLMVPQVPRSLTSRRISTNATAGSTPRTDTRTAGGSPSSPTRESRVMSNIFPPSTPTSRPAGERSRTAKRSTTYRRSPRLLSPSSEQHVRPNYISLNSSSSKLSIGLTLLQERKMAQTFPPSTLKAALQQPPQYSPLTAKALSAGHYQYHGSSDKEPRKQPSIHAWRHPVFREDEDKEVGPLVGPSLDRDAVSSTTQQHSSATSPIIITRPLTTSPQPVSSSDLSSDPPRISASSTAPILPSTSFSSSLSSLGRPTRLQDAPGNFSLEHIETFQRHPILLDAAKKTSQFQLKRRQVEHVGKEPFAQGSYGIVWKGNLHVPHHSQSWSPSIIDVAIKIIQVKTPDYERLLKKLFREVVPLCAIGHPNIARIRGYLMNGKSAWIITDWQKFGNAIDYLKDHPGADRLSLIIDIVNGLCHLHSCEPPIVHGDLKGDNVLVGDDHSAKLTDLGLAKILEDTLGTAFTTSSMGRGCLRFLAPELYSGGGRTMESDVWALGGLILQIATDLLPFHGMKKNEVQAELYAKRAPNLDAYGWFPHKPLLQPLIEGCWEIEPHKRWTASEIASYLKPPF